MATLKKLYIRTTSFPKERIASIERAHELEEQYAVNRLKVEADLKVLPDFLEGAKVESNNSLDGNWLFDKVSDLRYHIVHLDLTGEEWSKLGLRKTLYGQVTYINTKHGKQAITYGRWSRKTDRHTKYMPKKLHPITALALGIWHEDTHALSWILDVPDLTHYHFYGMKDGTRFARRARPEMAWAPLPFERLPTLEDRHASWLSLSMERLKEASRRLRNLFNRV